MQTTPTAAIVAQQLTRTLPLAGDHIQILKGLSFKIEPGEWVALMGPSGSGKSTLLGILAGIDTTSGGQLLLDGENITNLKEAKLAQIRNRKIGIIFQSFNLIPTLTAQENVEVPLYITAQASQAPRLAREMLELVGLGDRLRHRPHQLSGGQQQRVAIARALVTQPRFLMADEPTGNLDSTTGQQVLELFADLRRQLGLTFVIATHDGAVASRADRILRLVDGHLVQASQPALNLS
jgi:putative ABC transport system ATP-binding protein